jgi:hypothetical protein
MGFPTTKILLYSTITTIALFLALLFVGSIYEAGRLKKSSHYTYFKFNHSNLRGISLLDLGFSENDNKRLNLVLNNLQPKHKIDFKLVSANKSAADYKKLFRILHLLIDGGIKGYHKT